MVNVLRRFSQPIMVVITVLVIVSFAYWGPSLYNKTDGELVAMTLNGKDITTDQWQRQSRKVGIHASLGGGYIQSVEPMMRFTRKISGPAVARSFVLEAEADALGITATDDEVKDVLGKLPGFHGQDGQFDPKAFSAFSANVLNANGYNEDDFVKIFLTSEVRAAKLREMVSSTFAASPEEAREKLIRQKLTTEASYIAIRHGELAKDIKVTDEEIAKKYGEQKELLKTEEERRVKFAAWLIAEEPAPAATPDAKPGEKKPATPPTDPKERNKKLQKAADQAYAFREDLLKKKGTFEELAKQHGGTVVESKDFFTTTNGPDDVENSPQAAEAAFALDEKETLTPVLSAAQGLQKGAYVLTVVEKKAPRQRELAEVKVEIEGNVKSDKARELAKVKADELRPKIEEQKKAGKTFYEAAQALGVKAEPYPVFGGGQRGGPNEFSGSVPAECAKLGPGEISPVISSPSAHLIVHLDMRKAGDDKEIEAAITGKANEIAEQKGQSLFAAWFEERAKAAGVDKVVGLQ